MFFSQMKWLAKSKDSYNIPIVLHVGDVVDMNNDGQYEIASNGFKLLDDAGIPYAITLGNHDTGAVGEFDRRPAPGDGEINMRITDKFNKYFPVHRFTAQKARYEKDKSDNACYEFKAGGLNWLILTLEYLPRQEALSWACRIVSEHPSYNVIVLTHSYLRSDGEIEQKGGYGGVSPQMVYEQLVKKYKNIRIVLCGHTGSSVWRDDIGSNGNHIYQILQDYQGEDYGGGYIRLVEIDVHKKTIAAKMYSPYYNHTKVDSSKFSFTNVEFIK